MTKYEHTPVLLNEVLRFLDPQPGQSLVDATLGGGGYSRAILQKLGRDGKLLSVDLDLDAVENSRKEKSSNWEIVHGNFAHLDKIVEHHKFGPLDGIVADLGLSSYELDEAGRGISFAKKEVLDMRFNLKGEHIDAKFVLNTYDQARLVKIFEEYSEEKFARKIAKSIVEERKKEQIHYTTDLYRIIEDSLPKPIRHKANDSARRIFQALRIEVNHELENLQEFLPKAFDLLKPGGRLAVVSFHSLEDRMVKQYFLGLSLGCVCPIDFPQCVCGKNPQGKILTKKPVTASEAELEKNPRSKPAKLRVVEKI